MMYSRLHSSFIGDSSGNLSANTRDAGKRQGINPCVGKIPGGGNGNPFLPRQFYGQRNLLGHSPWGCKDLDMTLRRNIHPHRCCTARRPQSRKLIQALGLETRLLASIPRWAVWSLRLYLGCPWINSEITEISFSNKSNILVFSFFIDRKIAGGFREAGKWNEMKIPKNFLVW